MKKLLIYSLCMFAVSLGFVSCSDDDDVPAGSDRLFRTMFRCDNNTGKGDSDPYNCAVVDLNDVHLYWFGVEGAYGYQIRWALQPNVSGGAQAWHDTDSLGLLEGDTILVGQDVLDCVIKDLNYQTDYRFAIRTLNSADLNDPKNSEWYGHGDGRGWAEYLGLQTAARYEVPSIIQTSDITKTSMIIHLNRSTAGYTDEQMQGFAEHFTIDGDVFKVDYLTITPSKSSPNAVVPEQFKKYTLTDADWELGYILVEGLTENAVYNIDVWDADIPVSVDANYNPLLKRTKGDPGPPILLTHVPCPTDTVGKGTDGEVVYDISQYNSMRLDEIISDYCSSMTLAENQVFYLEGGKAYHFSGNPSIYKGLTLRTNPEDLAQGKRATLYLNGLTESGTNVNTCNFMLGRQPQSGENSSIPLDIDSVRFMDLDVNAPKARTYGHANDGLGGASGNYFMNMYSNGMGINVTLLEMNNCTFEGLRRGFFRIQGSNDFNIHNLVIKNCQFFNTGYYDQGGKGYNIIFADHNGKPKSNILENIVIDNNVFCNTPHGSIITDNNRNLVWDESVRWNITITNNTFVNHATRSAVAFFNFRYMPGGSTLTIKNNFWTVTKDEADAVRVLNCQGCDIRNIQGGDGSGVVTFDIANNWSTNNNLTAGQIFTKGAFSAKSNAPGKFLSSSNFPSGTEELDVHVDDISAVELFKSPNPKYYATDPSNHMEHQTDDKSCLNFQDTEKVRNSKIFQLGIGAQRLRDNIGK
ncbi:MAG: right-handed parallel beta-helix repeat-containing protein [Prevotella sp.]|nr:right-handed parallel beta-helix repeat-containing protein [Prevotella sp.]